MRILLGWVLAFLVAPLLSGCWASKTALMPQNERDDIPLTGEYRSAAPNGNEVILQRINSREFRLTEITNGRAEVIGIQVYDRFSVLPETDGVVGGGYYIVEHRFDDQGDGYPYAYTLARISIMDSGSVQFDMYLVNCPPDRPTIEMLGVKPCPFSTYDEIRAEAAKTVEWIDAARAAVFTLDFRKATDDPGAGEASEE